MHVPLTAHSVAPPRLVYGSLDVTSGAGASIWLRTRNGLTTSRLVRPWRGVEMARVEGQAEPSDFTGAWEEYLAAIAVRRHEMGR